MNKIDRIINYFRNLREEGMVVGPTNNVGDGKIAGTPQSDPGNPPVFKRKKQNKKYIYQHGLRKWWSQNNQKNK